MSVNLNDLNKYNEATMYNSVNVQPTKIDNVETPATSEVVSNDKKSETKLDKPAVSVAQESQKKENVTETSEYEKLQGDITSYNNDDKALKQIREDLRFLMSNEGTTQSEQAKLVRKEDKAKLSESIQENIKKLENVSKEDKATMSENIDSVISNNTNSLKDSIKEMTNFLKNFNSKEVPSFLQNIDYAKESSSFNKNSLNNLQGSFASVQSYLTQDLVSKLLR